MSVNVFFIWNAIISELLLKGWRLRAALITDRVTKALCLNVHTFGTFKQRRLRPGTNIPIVRLYFQDQDVRERLYSVVTFALIAIPNT